MSHNALSRQFVCLFVLPLKSLAYIVQFPILFLWVLYYVQMCMFQHPNVLAMLSLWFCLILCLVLLFYSSLSVLILSCFIISVAVIVVMFCDKRERERVDLGS